MPQTELAAALPGKRLSMTSADASQPSPAPTTALLNLPDEILEQLFISAPLAALMAARLSCHSLMHMVSRPAVMLPHVMRVNRLRPLPQDRAALSQLMAHQAAAAQHLQDGTWATEPVTSNAGPLLDVAETPCGARVALTRPLAFWGMRLCDANGHDLWQVRTHFRESFMVPPRLSGDASSIVYLVRSHGNHPESLYVAREGKTPLVLPNDDAAAFTHAKFAPYDDRLVTVQERLTGDRIRCFDTRQGTEQHAWNSSHITSTTAIAYADDKYSLASGHRDSHVVQLWDVRAAGHAQVITSSVASPMQLVFAPDSRRLFIGGQQGLSIWDRRTGHAQPYFDDRACHELAIAPNGVRLATKEKYYGRETVLRQRLRVYDMQASKAPLLDDCTDPGPIRFSNDGTRLFVKGTFSGQCLDFSRAASAHGHAGRS